MKKYTRILILFLLVLWDERSLGFNIFSYSPQSPLASPSEDFPPPLGFYFKRIVPPSPIRRYARLSSTRASPIGLA